MKGATHPRTAADAHEPSRGRVADKTELVISLLLAGKSLAEVGKEADLGKTSLWELRKSDEFRKKYTEARDEMLGGAVDLLHSRATDFVNALHAVATDKSAHPQSRATASREGLSALFRAREILDLAERVEKLERASAGASEIR